MLSSEERAKFVRYLNQHIADNEIILTQIGSGGGFLDNMVKKYRAENLAMKVVLKILDVETETLPYSGEIV